MDMKIAVIGGGYWGKNLIRNFYQLGCLHTVCDSSPAILEEINQLFPGLSLYSSFDQALLNQEIRAVVIASPAVFHFELAKQALLHNKDVFVEKPLSLSAKEGEELVALAQEKNLILMVGHLLQYHPVVTVLKKLINTGELGKIQYIYSNRLNFGKIRREENILWSFAPHDISVILSLLNELPISVSATGSRHLHPEIDDTTISHMSFSNGVNAHIFVSWLHPFKEQKLVVIGDKQMAVFDDTLSWESKLMLYSHKVIWVNQIPQAEKAQGKPVPLEECEPLKIECAHFINCIKNRSMPFTDGNEGVNVLKVLNAFQASLDKSGAKIKLDTKENEYYSHPTAWIDKNTQIGTNTKVWHFTHIMSNTTIGNECSFGQNCVVGPNVIIGNGVKVQNNISIYDGVEIEDDVFLGPSMVFTNVINPRSFIIRKNEFKKTRLKKGCSIGANATIICGVTLGEYCMIGAGSVVTKDVKPYSLVFGVPAKYQGWVSQAGNKLEFNSKGLAKDSTDNTIYELKNESVYKIAQEIEVVHE